MNKKILSFLDKFRTLRVIADPNDDTITFTPVMCRRTHVFDKEKAEMLVFRTAEDNTYNFCFAEDVPNLQENAATYTLQYNTQYYTVGFHCPMPTVNRIFYDYGLPIEPRKLRVTIHTAGNGLIFYKMHPNRSLPYRFK